MVFATQRNATVYRYTEIKVAENDHDSLQLSK
jgi:hypothetical protein